MKVKMLTVFFNLPSVGTIRRLDLGPNIHLKLGYITFLKLNICTVIKDVKKSKAVSFAIYNTLMQDGKECSDCKIIRTHIVGNFFGIIFLTFNGYVAYLFGDSEVSEEYQWSYSCLNIYSYRKILTTLEEWVVHIDWSTLFFDASLSKVSSCRITD